MLKLLSHFNNVKIIASNLINADNLTFQRFFGKLYYLDARALYFFCRANIDKFSPTQLEFANIIFARKGLKL
ncbi:MAG: hypothetical protein FWG64_08560 [Firmicutes bacterium]|nr:hypothetical protein [Bacillota bacterium]